MTHCSSLYGGIADIDGFDYYQTGLGYFPSRDVSSAGRTIMIAGQMIEAGGVSCSVPKGCQAMYHIMYTLTRAIPVLLFASATFFSNPLFELSENLG